MKGAPRDIRLYPVPTWIKWFLLLFFVVVLLGLFSAVADAQKLPRPIPESKYVRTLASTVECLERPYLRITHTREYTRRRVRLVTSTAEVRRSQWDRMCRGTNGVGRIAPS